MLSLFLAKRFFKNNIRKGGEVKSASPPALRVATAGIAVGLAVMIISICVVRGFQQEVRSKFTGFASHIEVIDINSLGSPETYPVVTDATLMNEVKKTPKVKHVQRFSQKMGILKTEDNFTGVALKGCGPEYDLQFIRSYLVEGKVPDFSDKTSSNNIVISQTIADKLGLKVGSKVYSYYFASTIKQRRFTVVGIYDTHLKQYDNAVVFTDLRTVNQLNQWLPDQSSGLEIQLESFDDIAEAQHYLATHVGGKVDKYKKTYFILPIQENPNTASVLSWLGLLDVNVMVILIIMMCVTGFAMISGLLILILERTSTIGVLKALGATNTRIRHTFLWYAMFIVSKGLLYGNIIGIALVLLQQFTHFVQLNPDVYYVTYVPVELNVWWVIGLNIATLAITMISLILPSFLVSRVQPAKAIQFD